MCKRFLLPCRLAIVNRWRPQEEKADSRPQLGNWKSAQEYQTMYFQTPGLFYEIILRLHSPLFCISYFRSKYTPAPFRCSHFSPNQEITGFLMLWVSLYVFPWIWKDSAMAFLFLGVSSCSSGKLQNSIMVTIHNSMMFVHSYLLTCWSFVC